MSASSVIRILHLSDFHFKEAAAWDADPLLNSLADSIAGVVGEGLAPDFVALTGDIAFAGKAAEYDLASAWLEKKLFPRLPDFDPPSQLLVIPGNHDADRSKVDRMIEAVQSSLLKPDQELIKQSITGSFARPILARHDAYVDFANRYRASTATLSVPWWGEMREVRGARVGFAGLCSSWLCSKEKEQGELLIGRYQRNVVLGALADAPIRVALVHHPYSYLAGFDGEESELELEQQCLVVLRGHLHKERARAVSSPDATSFQLAAGSAYAGSEYPNAYQLVEIPTEPADSEVRVHFRVWHNNRWIKDRNAYENATDGVATFHLPSATPKRAAPDAGLSYEARDYLANYRARLKPKFDRWDMANVGVTHPAGTGGHPAAVGLDEIYQPLRLGPRFDPSKLSEGEVITPQALLAREKPLVIRGPAGSGKTTWMRWTFRKLLQDERALPVMVELRRLANIWHKTDAKGKDRSLDTYIEDWAAEHVANVGERGLLDLLSDPAAPRPIIMVDGWDELGKLGEELRDKLLGFMAAHWRAAVVVTSRPYGEMPPSSSEGFEVLDVQPISDAEVRDFATRFYHKCFGDDGDALNASTERFLRALERSPEPKELARTALLLTMMLLIGRTRPLPDKRHLLYQACVEHFLTALPDLRDEEGVQPLREQWRPQGTEERLRVVASLAFAMQEQRYDKHSRGPITLTWEQLIGLLPEAWNTKEKSGFLVWLSGPAGLLVDRADGMRSFVHLSFQEYLAAKHLDAVAEGEERVAACLARVGQRNWWETLRLWAALVEAPNQARLEPVLHALLAHDNGPWLAGLMFADGLGSDEAFGKWVPAFSELIARSSKNETELIQISSSAWAGSQRHDRKGAIAAGFNSLARECDWLGWAILDGWASRANLEPRLSTLPEHLNSRVAIDVLQGRFSSAWHTAISRVFTVLPLGIAPPWEVAALQVWPGRRLWAGRSLQSLVCLGGGSTLRVVAPRILGNASQQDKELPEAATIRATEAVKKFTKLNLDNAFNEEVENVLRDTRFGKEQMWIDNYVCKDCNDEMTVLTYSLIKVNFISIILDAMLDALRMDIFSVGAVFDSAAPEPSEESKVIVNSPGVAVWQEFWDFLKSAGVTPRFLNSEIGAWLHAGPRSHFAYGKWDGPLPVVELMRAACLVSLNPDADAAQFDKALTDYPADGESLWPALARYLARCATDEDNALMLDLAAHPERREGSLAWGLKYIVRGDVILDENSEITLDALADEVGVPRLPLLDAAPRAYKIVWEDELSESESDNATSAGSERSSPSEPTWS